MRPVNQACFLGLMMLSASNAFAFHMIYCSSQASSVSTCALSDAPFGFILSAYIENNGSKEVYTIWPNNDPLDHVNASGFAEVKFDSSKRLLIGPNSEAAAKLYDKDGNLISDMSCAKPMPGECDDLGPGGLQ